MKPINFISISDPRVNRFILSAEKTKKTKDKRQRQNYREIIDKRHETSRRNWQVIFMESQTSADFGEKNKKEQGKGTTTRTTRTRTTKAMIANTYVFISFFLCMSCLSFLCFFSPLPSPSLLFIRSPTHFELTKKYVQRLVFHRYIRRHRGDCSSFSRSLGRDLCTGCRWWIH